MNTLKTAAVAAIALIGASSGCAPRGSHHVTAREVVSATSGGPEEVWLVVEEVGGDYDRNRVLLRHDTYAVYHCIPAGCKRVGELSGLEATSRRNSK